ncbi:phage tail protein [Thermoactinomyces daqus]|uniref:Phage tail protein n=1 Tax=Thermoactinomyces daqus TaxID=1329516 RepID=A0A7W1X8G6_9BACL|nr:phage tail protein [Thermoactinomyces daqus]MBA4542003.1 phage tail protein [Thermoactinomyces daqus]
MLDRIFLFDNTETYRAVAVNDNPGALSFFDAVWTEKLNAEVTLEFSVDANHPDAQYVVEDGYAVIPDLDNGYQAFIIRKVDETHSAQGLVKHAYCENAANELLDEPIREYSTASDNPANILEQLLSGTRWQVGTVDTFAAQAFSVKYKSVLAAIQDVLTTFGGEIRFRVEFTPGNATITGRYVDLVMQRGSDTGRRFEYSRDITSIKRTGDSGELKTALIGLGKADTDPETGVESRVTFTDIVWSKANGDPVDKPAGQDWVGDPDALNAYGRLNADGSLRHRFGFFEDADESDPANLLRKAWDALQAMKVPAVQYDMSVVDLERLTGYDHMKVRLGDTVHVIDREFAPALLVEARVIEIDRYLNEPEKTQIKLGNFAPELTDGADRLQNIEQRLADRSGVWDGKIGLGQVIDVYNNEIRSSNGYVYITDQDGILVLDRPKDQNPTKAVRIKGGIVGISDNYQGDNTVYRTALDGSGIVADVITTGTMQADRIKGGNLTLGGSGQMGHMWVYDENDKLVADFDAGYGGYKTLFVGDLKSPTVVARTPSEMKQDSYYNPAPYTLYVRPTGDDVNGDGSSANPFRTIQRAIDYIPTYNSAVWTIDCKTPSGSSAYEYYEHVEIQGFVGDGYIKIDLSGSYFMGEIRMSANLQYIEIVGGKWRHDGIQHPLDTRPYATINCLRTHWVYLHDAVIFADNADYCVASQAAHIILSKVKLVNSKVSALYARDGGSIHGANLSGSGHSYAVMAAACGHISLIDQNTGITTPIPAASANAQTAGGGTFLYNGSLVTSSYSETPPMTGFTRQLLPFDGDSWRYSKIGQSYDGGNVDDGYGWQNDSDPMQGAEFYARDNDYGHNHAGFVWWWSTDLSDLQTTLAGKTIVSVRLRFKRLNEFGVNQPHNIKVWIHDYSKTGSEPATFDPKSALTNGTVVGTYQWGDDIAANLPTSFATAIINGTMGGIAFFNEDYTQSAKIALNSVIMEISYK